MKKLILILLSLIPILSLHAQDSDKVVIDHLKYIVAYHLNNLSLDENAKGNEEVVAKFKSLGTSEDRVMSDMIATLEGTIFTTNIALCKEINSLSVSAESINDLKSFFKEDFFKIETGAIYSFLSKRASDKAKIDRLKKEIGKSIDDYLDTKDFPVSNKNGGMPIPSQKEKNNESNRGENKETGENNLLPTIFVGFSVILCIGLLGLGYICRKLWKEKNSLKEELYNREDEIASLKKENEKFLKETDKYRRDNDRLENDNNRLRRQLEERYEKEKIMITTQSQYNSMTNRFVAEKEPESVAKISYVGIPRNGTFVGEFDSFKPGKCLYKVISSDGHNGTFEFYNSAESIEIVKQSRTEFLEPACNITNLDDSTFNKIDTLKEGRVEKINNVWRIIEKADIELK